MKPYKLLWPLAGAVPVLSLVAVGAIPGSADSRSSGWDTLPEAISAESHQVAALPEPSTARLWAKVRFGIRLDELASQLRLPPSGLAQLNALEADHRLRAGDWVMLPANRGEQARQLASIDASELRRRAPLSTPPPLEAMGVVRLGDNLRKLAQRYGMSLQDLLRLNPGLQAAGLVAGTQIRVANAAPVRSRMILGLNPVGSGGLSWPELPNFGRPADESPRPANSTWIWPSRGVFSSGYGWRWGRMHKGIDIASNVGTPIVAARSGQVSFAGWHDGGYGFMVEIQHEDGSKSLYAHNSRLLVQVGQVVAQGVTIAEMGSTGRSTGPHLHFEIHPPGRGAVNPLTFLPGRA
ncbi:M23 family metallopeptidase [Synechococcus sp. CS-1324]|uniref:M23 family metallopeptidase n=1 Tax=unclassified Synechococcus TaxID=2626047 RepID=UPI000DB68072|nr:MULTISPECIES: M23 family metallopeptidase [unclassified Synechococcus]MCT0214395.1 M23 family metallopeptidase [Synechococcus sp. CS-1326]MCT0231839.1 M23 family metallopeptidase [Synechococcus sp. CS-1324]MCT0233302.1 M23 family metallopeptidase [Synechococcus sp. CS-1327]PZV05828.1 MAG: peptidoglycan-binding protein [Cyanobium sp.]